MSRGRKKKPVPPKIHHAAKLLIKGPWLKTAEAMGATLEFQPAELEDKSVHRAVQRHRDYLLAEAKNKQPAEIIVVEDHQQQQLSPLAPSDGTSLSSSSASSASPTKKPPAAKALSPYKKLKSVGGKAIRMTGSQAQQARMNKHKREEKEKKLFKQLTRRWDVERKKTRSDPTRLSAQKLCDQMNALEHTNFHPKTVQNYVRAGKVGESPMKRGNVGRVPHEIYKKFLVPAFRSYIQITQNNGHGSDLMKRKLSAKVNALVTKPGEMVSTTQKLCDRLLTDSGVDLDALKNDAVEDRRRVWTTWAFINLWFDGWGATLVLLGFATMVDGELVISNEQLGRILNLDETGVSLDGSTKKRGGRRPVIFVDRSLPILGRCASKSSSTATLICGSTALQEALPPHIQLTTSAKSTETMQFRTEMLVHMHDVNGKFGHSLPQKFPVTIGMNEKGGMDDEEFKKYLVDLIMRLYPDVEDRPGKRVMVKLDSGPGRSFDELIAELRLMGVALYPGVPNTTSVTQETDQNYELFKDVYRANLEKFAAERERHFKTTTANMSLLGLFVFGGQDPETGAVFENAFQAAFNKEKCLRAWQKVGAAPLTRACLNNPKVRHLVGADENDPELTRLRGIQAENNMAVYHLKALGYPGNILKAQLLEREETVRAGLLTEPQSDANVKAIAKLAGYGKKFLKTGGYNLTSDFGFKVLHSKLRECEAGKLEAEKKKRQKLVEFEDSARAVLAEGKNPEQLSQADLKKLLLWYQLPVTEKKPDGKTKNIPKARLRRTWEQLLEDKAPEPSYQKWTEDDEAKLVHLKSDPIDMEETALGRLMDKTKAQYEATVVSMDKQKAREYVEKLSRMVESGTRFVDDNLEESDRIGV